MKKNKSSYHPNTKKRPNHRKKFRGNDRLTGLDKLFLVGLTVFISYLILANPWTPNFVFGKLLFWSSITMLFLSMAPDYLNIERAREWLKEYRRTRMEGFYRKVYNLFKNYRKYFNSDFFFSLGIVLSIGGVIWMFLTGIIINPFFGISYALLLRALLG